MASLSYMTVDVFTDRQFGGNPLAVVFDAQQLTTEVMQSIAAEFNYSETTFVLPPKKAEHTAHVRIFTPRAEMPFAGHPNVGTAFALARRDPAIAAKGRVIFEEGAGLVPVELHFENGRVTGAELTAPEVLSRRSSASVEAVAECLTLKISDVRSARHAPHVVSVGLPFLVTELSSRDALRRARPNLAAFEKLLPLDKADALYLYSMDSTGNEPGCDVAARMFAPFDGIVEDAATGSATAAAAALLAALSSDVSSELKLRFLQGVDMGRPSVLSTRVLKQDGKLKSVHVGGRCVPVMNGTLELAGTAP